MTAIEAWNVSKTYPRHTSRRFLRAVVSEWLGGKREAPFYAVRDVSFRMDSGESVAVVGRNGAGKSTLLSLIAGLSWPDEGQLVTHGRLAALLELGAGFHPDLTGAENVRVNAAVMGLSRKQTLERFERIVEFSGVREFINEPLRTYSTGMSMRLAFSVAVNVDPDVLLVDEVLAVGDQSFQARCIERLFELKERGTTFLCVSHGTALLKQLCERALWLESGRLVRDGPILDVLAEYEGQAEAAPAVSEEPVVEPEAAEAEAEAAGEPSAAAEAAAGANGAGGGESGVQVRRGEGEAAVEG